MTSNYHGLIDTYRDYLPLTDSMRIISLNEGRTPLVALDNFTRACGIDAQVYVKFEGLNPTGSFKDRGMTMAVTHALSTGAKAIVCASTGNTSAAAAAYAARAGITAFVVIPEGKIALGKLAQTVIMNAVIVQISGNFDVGMQLVKELAKDGSMALVNSVNPYRLQGQKTAAFEIIEALGDAPDYHYIPVGNAGNISAHWMGYCEFSGQLAASSQTIDYPVQLAHKTNKRPVMVGYQAAGAAPFVHGSVVKDPETIATAIRIGDPQSWDFALAAQTQSGGWFGCLSDDDIIHTQQLLAASEGVFCEPASAASLAGLVADYAQGRVKKGSRIVCTLTGNGIKDADAASRAMKPERMIEVAPVLDEVRTKLVPYL